LFDDPNPLPVRVHDIAETDPDGFWNDPIATSLACGACHNVKLDIDGDGVSPFAEDDSGDDDGDLQLNGNELDDQDGTLDDLVLQTTFDEWQDYVAAFDQTIGRSDPPQGLNDQPLGCVDCHMPAIDDGPVVDQAPGVMARPDRPRREHTFVGVDYDLDIDAYTKLGLSEDAINDIVAERAALLGSAITLQVDDAVDNGDGTETANVVVTNNLLGHSFPTGFAFARQFWLEVSATDSKGNEVCLVNLFAAAGVASPCSSGTVADRGDLVPQCDPQSVADTLGLELADVPNGNIKFAEPLPVGQCDPWLANFQKILTDGDPDQTGTFTEVAYQSFLKDIVKTRSRMADNLTMAPLQSVRLDKDLQPQDTLTIPYVFDTSQLGGGPIRVKATMRFRHLPPEFVRSLATEQQALTNITDSARIDDPQALIDNLVITDVVTAQTGDGPVLACTGPQNDAEASIVDCVEDVSGVGAVDVDRGVAGGGSGGRFVDPWTTALIVGAFAVIGALVAGRRRPWRRRLPGVAAV
jgi:hypothetical protein